MSRHAGTHPTPRRHPEHDHKLACPDLTPRNSHPFELQGLSDEAAKSLVWRYVFAVNAGQYLLSHYRSAHGRKRPRELRAVRRFLRDNHELSQERLYDRFLRAMRGLQGSFALEAFGAKALVELKGSSEGARAIHQLDMIERSLEAATVAMGCEEQHVPALLLVDQLEQVWSNDPDSDATIIGLLLAAKRVDSYMPGMVRCVVFIREDIYDTLQFGDGDKYHGDEIRIEWTTDRLSELALARARLSLNEPSLSMQQLWTEILPPSIAGEPTPDYIFSRMIARPRDLIQFLNAARDVTSQG